MRKFLLFTLIAISIAFCSWTNDTLNANSWCMRVGQNELLASWKNNQMGDTVLFDKTKFKSTDTLFAERYLCGFIRQPAVTTVTIKNQQNQIIKQVVSKGTQLGMTGYIPLSEIIILNGYKSGQTLGVFLTIDFKNKDFNETVLLGRLKIK